MTRPDTLPETLRNRGLRSPDTSLPPRKTLAFIPVRYTVQKSRVAYSIMNPSTPPDAREKTTTAKTPVWKATSVAGLYLHTPSKRYYARISVRNKRPFRSLKTKVWTIAQIRMAKAVSDAAQQRLANQSTQNPTGGAKEPRTMGDLEQIFLTRVDASSSNPKTRENWKAWMKRLVRLWPGSLRATLPSQITYDALLAFRTQLTTTRFKITGTNHERVGYRPAVINQTLKALNALFLLAKEHHLIFASPFDQDNNTFGDGIWLPKKTRKPQLPSRFEMERVFDEINRGPEVTCHDRWYLASVEQRTKDVSEHVRFLAFSGARVSEANKVCWSDVSADSIMIRGTKSASSTRPVPIVPAMRALLDEMRARRAAEGIPLNGPILRVASCRDSLKRACGKVGIKKLTHHDLRHYFITVCIESGVDIPTIARWVGHADGGALLMKIYAHLRDLHSTQMAQQVCFGPKSASTTPAAAPQSNVG
jgi:integrase